MKRLIKAALVVALLSCSKERYCECTTTVLVEGNVVFEETSILQYEGKSQECENSFIVDSYSQKIIVICNEK